MNKNAVVLLALAAPTLLMACTAGVERAQTGAIATTAETSALQLRGNEPFWRIDLGRQLRLQQPGVEAQRMDYTRVDGADGVIRVQPVGQPWSLQITRRLCRDSMTGMPYPYTAWLLREGARHPGCGGDPQQLLQGVSWQIERINGAPVLPGSEANLRFVAPQRVTGLASCNTYFADYTLTGEGLSLGPVVSTRKACEPGLMEQEHKVLSILQGTQGFDMTADGGLLLYDADGQGLQARPAD